MTSHRSGETEDNYIADLAVGLCTGQVHIWIIGNLTLLFLRFVILSVLSILLQLG
jgi:hypothetical protein